MTAETAPPAGSSPLAKSILEGTAPRLLRLAAARCALPLPRPDLFRLLVALVADGDQEVRAEAQRALDGWPKGEMLALGADPSSDPAVLAWLLGWPGADTNLLAALFSNGSTPFEALAAAARCFPAEKLDTLLLNQTLLIENPRLLDEMEANPQATALHRSKAEEIRRHFLAPQVVSEPAPPVEPPVPAAETPSAPHSGAGPSPAAPPVEGEPLPPAPAAGGGEPEPHAPPEAEVPAGVMARILKMNVAEKITLAQKGTREERSILIRDSNRSVQDSVLNSPKLSDNEVEAIARMRSVNEDILRQIAANRDWLKNYSIVHGLATNPKTPLGISMSLLQRLTTRDLKLLLTDKNIPDALRRHARKTVEIRVQKPGSGPTR